VVQAFAAANSGLAPFTGRRPSYPKETIMNLTCAIRRPARNLPGLAGAALASLAGAAPASLAATPAAQAAPRPRPPGWNKHPPLPAHAHPLATGAIPGWQLTLMALTVILLVATLVAIGNPGPGRTPAGARTYRLSGDRIRRRADPRRQPHGEPPHPATWHGRDGPAARFLEDITAAASVATGQHRPAPAAVPRRRMMIAPRLRPRTVQLCICCRQNPAGFWVSQASDQTVRRPWCLSCCHQLDQSRYHVIPFDGHGGTGRLR
jgi:hypothetical protein